MSFVEEDEVWRVTRLKESVANMLAIPELRFIEAVVSVSEVLIVSIIALLREPMFERLKLLSLLKGEEVVCNRKDSKTVNEKEVGA